jgi:hypothetical protein
MPPKMKKKEGDRPPSVKAAKARKPRKTNAEETSFELNVDEKKKIEDEQQLKKEIEEAEQRLRDEAMPLGKSRGTAQIKKRFAYDNKKLKQALVIQSEGISPERQTEVKKNIILDMMEKELLLIIDDHKTAHAIHDELKDSSYDENYLGRLLAFLIYCRYMGVVNTGIGNSQQLTLKDIIRVYNETDIPQIAVKYTLNEVIRSYERRVFPTKSIRTNPNNLNIFRNIEKIDFGIEDVEEPDLPNIEALTIQQSDETVVSADPTILNRALSIGVTNVHTDAFLRLRDHILTNLYPPREPVDFSEIIEKINENLARKFKTPRSRSKPTEPAGIDLGDDDTEEEDEINDDYDNEDSFIDDDDEDEDEDDGFASHCDSCASCGKDITKPGFHSIIKDKKNGYTPVCFCDSKCMSDNRKLQ